MNQINSRPGVVIVGAGQGGGEASTALRQQGYQGSITLIGDEPQLPYRRPPLSKAFLLGDMTVEDLQLKPAETYEQFNIQCNLGTRVETIDRHNRQVQLSDGSNVAYEHLILATGGQARRLTLPGSQHRNVHYIRTVSDIERLRLDLQPGRRLVMVGGGYVGLEVAAVACKKGLHVTVVEAMPRVLARVTAPELSNFYEQAHRRRGVSILTGCGVEAFHGQTQVEQVVLADGRRLDADLVIVGIGLIPGISLAQQCNLAITEGAIAVDAHTRTSDPHIFAIGDCTYHENRFYEGRPMRLESVPNATEQARIAAANICGKDSSYDSVPWFWSDQFDLKLQMVGLSSGYDQLVIRGSMSDESFIAFYLAKGTIISADAVNRPQDFLFAKKLVAQRSRLSPEQLADMDTPLKSLLTLPPVSA
ncbi:NAD(P)/FAD-dependent oxidoreductase [Pseudomonas sp. P8_241]|uniref:NAD(P)/FAD-dependent oxidoreductase n=1 Tax=Pseudomonas sp. P8_241 TaxID=3043445 RepID=UPI002A361EAE|nr:FAD-dependent oxidoreductase [Pseudomonas sp. P8_241]WPN45129.1 FAD-dependent oxidoreductase [Pseudomonas sp. P8_241]